MSKTAVKNQLKGDVNSDRTMSPPPALQPPKSRRSKMKIPHEKVIPDELQTLIKGFHHSTSAFITQCYLRPLQNDGVECVHMQDFVETMRAVKHLFIWFSENRGKANFSGSFGNITRAIGIPLRIIVTLWKREVVMALGEYKNQKQPKSNGLVSLEERELARKVLDLFLVDYEGWVSEVNHMIAKWIHFLNMPDMSSAASKKPTIVEDRDHSTAFKMVINSGIQARKRAFSSPMVTEVTETDSVATDTTLMPPYKPLAINTSTVFRPPIMVRSPSADQLSSRIVQPRTISPKTANDIMKSPIHFDKYPAMSAISSVPTANQWNIDELFSNLKSLREHYEKDLAANLQKKKSKNALADPFAQYRKPPAVDKSLPITPNSASVAAKSMQTAEKTPEPMPRTMHNVLSREMKHAESSPDLFTAPVSSSALRYTVTQETSANASVVPSIPLDYGRLTHQSRSAPSLPSIIVTDPMRLSKPLHYGDHDFVRLTMFEDIKKSLKSLFRPSPPQELSDAGKIKRPGSRKFASTELSVAPSKPYSTSKCRICEDRLYWVTSKIQCRACNMVLHEKCGQDNDLNQWACNKR